MNPVGVTKMKTLDASQAFLLYVGWAESSLSKPDPHTTKNRWAKPTVFILGYKANAPRKSERSDEILSCRMNVMSYKFLPLLITKAMNHYEALFSSRPWSYKR